MDYSKLLFQLVYEVPQKEGLPPKAVPVLPQAYHEHRFSDHFIYGYRDNYVDVYEKDSCLLLLEEHTFSKVIEYQYHRKNFLLVQDCTSGLWGAYTFGGRLVREIRFSTKEMLIQTLYN